MQFPYKFTKTKITNLAKKEALRKFSGRTVNYSSLAKLLVDVSTITALTL